MQCAYGAATAVVIIIIVIKVITICSGVEHSRSQLKQVSVCLLLGPS